MAPIDAGCDPAIAHVPAISDTHVKWLCRNPFSIRQLGPEDTLACRAFFQRVERNDIRLRFGSLHFSADRPIPTPMGAFGGTAFAAVDFGGAVLGVSNLAPVSAATAEIAVIVRSDLKRRHIGRSLIAHTLARAEKNGLAEVVGYVLAENRAMLSLARAFGFRNVGQDLHLLELRRSVAPGS